MKSFEYTGSRFSVTPEIKAAFDDFGFVILKNLFKRDEVKKLIDFFENSQEIQSHAYGRDDGEGRKTRVALWNYPGDDIGSAVSRSKRVVYTLRDLLGGHELYHYHTKLMMKDAKVRSIFEFSIYCRCQNHFRLAEDMFGTRITVTGT